jgi:hypothetical protein
MNRGTGKVIDCSIGEAKARRDQARAHIDVAEMGSLILRAGTRLRSHVSESAARGLVRQARALVVAADRL